MSAAAGTVLILAGVCGALIAALCVAAPGSAPSQLPLFIGPLTTSVLANIMQVLAGGWGMVAARRPARAHTFLRTGGLGYLLWSLIESVMIRPDSPAVVAAGTRGSAAELPALAPLCHFVMAAIMIAVSMRRRV